MPTPTLLGPTRILYEALFTRARSTLTPTRTSAAAGPPEKPGEPTDWVVAEETGAKGARWGQKECRAAVAGVQA